MILSKEKTNQIYNQNYSKLKRYFLKNKIEINSSEDLAHDVLTKAILSIDKYKPEENIKFDSWLFSIAKNKLIDHNRYIKRKNQINIDDIGDLPEEELKEYDSSIKDILIKKLNKVEYEIADLYYFQGYKIKDLAIKLNKTNKSIENKIYYINKKLKDILIDYR